MTNKPVIILSKPQMHENIGATARAMANFGLDSLRLINPRDGVPSEKAYSMASGADSILDNAVIYADIHHALSDLNIVIATTARHRDMNKPVMNAECSVRYICDKINDGAKCGILFGGERAGLDNDDIVHADILVNIDVNPQFSSLNLAQSVLLMGYEWFKSVSSDVPKNDKISDMDFSQLPASKQDLHYFHEHLETELTRKNFFYPPEKKQSMVQTLQNLFIRAGMNTQEVRTMRGVIKALSKSHTE